MPEPCTNLGFRGGYMTINFSWGARLNLIVAYHLTKNRICLWVWGKLYKNLWTTSIICLHHLTVLHQLIPQVGDVKRWIYIQTPQNLASRHCKSTSPYLRNRYAKFQNFTAYLQIQRSLQIFSYPVASNMTGTVKGKPAGYSATRLLGRVFPQFPPNAD